MAKFKYFKRTTSNIGGNVVLCSNQLRLLALVDESKEIGVVARESGMEIAEFKGHMTKLYEMGLIMPVVKTVVQRYGPELLRELAGLLTYYVGPVADIILADVLSDMGIDDEKIPVEELDNFIGMLMEEIPDPDQKDEFGEKVKGLVSRAK